MPVVQALREPSKSNSVSMRRIACAAILLCFAAVVAASAQTYTTLATFSSNNATRLHGASGPLVQGIDGNFYGVAVPEADGGLIYKVTPNGTLTAFSAFCDTKPCTHGDVPSSLIRGSDGNFYGTTLDGGTNASPDTEVGGTIFKLTPTGTRTTLYNFCAQANCVDGSAPTSLVEAFSGGVYGDFYGTTISGGTGSLPNACDGCGTLFSLTSQGQFTSLYSFCSQSNCDDGRGSEGLVQVPGGIFYGTTCCAGSLNNGTLFRMTPAGAVTIVRQGNVGNPTAPLIQGTDGFFYGDSFGGGGTGANPCGRACGTISRVSASGAETILYDFCTQTGCPDGYSPESALIQATDGNFYGTTPESPGTIFKITPTGTFTILYKFCSQPDCADGEGSKDALVQGTDGKFYGTALGKVGTGDIVFSLDVGLPPFVTFLVSTGNVGNTVGILGQGFTGTTAVSFNGTAAAFTVKSDTFLTATVPTGATTGSLTVTTPSGTLTSNVAYRVTN
jgi:uncharacterized repeat protein (TIGR03803 family)